jgi:hypothetical protein
MSRRCTAHHQFARRRAKGIPIAVRLTISCLPLLAATGVLAQAVAPVEVASLSRSVVSARGRQSVLLRVPRFGRYAITATSGQGVSVQLVDRMAGPRESDGTPGERDGRIDTFLDQGEYKLLTEGHRQAAGEAKLEVHAFPERHEPKPPLLPELKLVTDEISDFQQASYWIEIEKTKRVAIEAAGRSLLDLRLWREGTWLVAEEPVCEIVQPAEGKPLRGCRLSASLSPGLYLLTAYGGPPRPWAEDDGRQPLYVRSGIPRLAMAGRRRFVMSPFGSDRYRVAGPANYFRLELNVAEDASLAVAPFDPDAPFGGEGHGESISKKSIPPVAEIRWSQEGAGDRLVTVSAAAGHAYLLQHFEVRQDYPFAGSGEYWVGSVHSGHPADSMDATGIIVRDRLGSERSRLEPLAADTIELDAKTGWARRSNLLATTTLFLHVKEAGSYELVTEGVETEARFEPFLTEHSADYKSPAFRPTPVTLEADAGYYELTLKPRRKGIAGLVLRPRGLVDVLLEKIWRGSAPTPTPVRGAVLFPRLLLDRDRSYTLYTNRQPEVETGLVVRPLPLDLGDALPIAQRPGEAVSVPFASKEPGTLRAEAEDGSLLEVSVDGGSWSTAVAVEAGAHTATVRNTRKESVVHSLVLAPRRLELSSPLPELPDSALAALPRFPVLTETTPQRFDLGRRSGATFLLRADKPGLFRLETTGLLATGGQVRTRTLPSLAEAKENGIGRNFALDTYLREGTYQVQVESQGETRGHLGLELRRSDATNGGYITSRIPARVTLAAGEAVSYSFRITTPGRFRVHSLGLGREFRCRLEDRDGWPLVTPGGKADVTLDFDSGHSRYVVLREVTTARAVTLIEPVGTPPARQGHGPHPLALGRRAAHLWLEPEPGSPREPDVWETTLPAPVAGTIDLTPGMSGRLFQVGVEPVEPISIDGGQTWRGALPAGRYRLEVVSARPNNRAPYEITVVPEQLVAGLDREVSAPVEIPVSIGEAGLFELTTFGGEDVKLSLTDGEGRLVASNDDRPDDWNAFVAATLRPGPYSLRVDPVGATRAATRVSLRRRAEKEEAPWTLPVATAQALGPIARLRPLQLPGEAGLLAVALRSGEAVGVALEAREAGSWRTLATETGRSPRLEVPLPKQGPDAYRLRLWSLDRRDSPAQVTAAFTAGPKASESKLASGVPLGPVPGMGGLATVAVNLSRPGVFRLDGPADGLRWCPAPLEACRPVAGGVASTGATTVWLAADKLASPKATRVRLQSGAKAALTIPLPKDGDARCDIAAGRGPVLVRAAARAGQPGVSLGPAQDLRRDARGMAVGNGTAIGVSLRPAKDQLARLWAAAPAPGGIEALVSQISFPETAIERGSAPNDGYLEGIRARGFLLTKGKKRIRLALGEGVVAAISRGDEIEALVGAGETAMSETIETEADRLTLLHTREEQDRFSVEVLPLGAASLASLAPGGVFEETVDRTGWRRLALPAASGPSRVKVLGSSGPATLVDGDGGVERGSDLLAPASGGSLLVPHQPGTLLVYRNLQGQEAPLLPEAPTLEVRPPAAIPLAGAAQILSFEVEAPTVFHVRVPQPVATLLKRGETPPLADLHPAFGRVDFYLAKGRAQLHLRALAGAPLYTTAEVTSSTVTAIAEGLGPETLLPPGGTRFFAFEVSRQGPVGLGVRADSDRVDATLLSATGHILGKGNVQMPDLPPGTYLLALEAPPDVAPIRARPAVVGLVTPSLGPPDEAIRQYLVAEEPTTAFTARRVLAPTPAAGATEVEEPGSTDQEGEQVPSTDEAAGDPTGGEQ